MSSSDAKHSVHSAIVHLRVRFHADRIFEQTTANQRDSLRLIGVESAMNGTRGYRTGT